MLKVAVVDGLRELESGMVAPFKPAFFRDVWTVAERMVALLKSESSKLADLRVKPDNSREGNLQPISANRIGRSRRLGSSLDRLDGLNPRLEVAFTTSFRRPRKVAPRAVHHPLKREPSLENHTRRNA